MDKIAEVLGDKSLHVSTFFVFLIDTNFHLNQLLMKKYILSFLSFLLLTPFAYCLQGGPDAYGYTWIDSNEPGGPVFNWIDITPSGNVVTGLSDDNSVAFVPIGIDFHFYWGDYDQVKIGSNGWVGFDNIGNIAHCFPTIPTPGGAGDNFLAPFMTDLNFDAVGNPAYCMYHYVLADSQFVISYLDVPWWSPNPPGYLGLNSFQIILDAKDSSITFQYLITDPGNFNDMPGCLSDLVVGIEGPTGSYGLQCYQDVLPPSNYAIKFKYPNPVLIDVPDITPNWQMNVDNGGEFKFNGQNVSIPINIKNVGNIDVNSNIQVAVTIQDQFFTTVANFNATITGGLDFGNDTTIQFSWIPSALGQYSLNTTITNTDDINSTNNTLTSELEIQDPNPGTTRFSYINPGETFQGTISWNSGNDDGVATRFIPSSYPIAIDSVGAYVGGTGDVRLEIYADDGPNNMPGTLMHTELFPQGSITLNAWVISELPIPDTVYSGGFYVVWLQANNALTNLGTVLNPPFSRRNLEFINGWAVYRDNEIQDFMLEAWTQSLCAAFSSTSTFTEVTCSGGNDGAIDLTPVGGNAPYTYSWTGGASAVEDPTNLGAGSYTVTITDNSGCQHQETIIVTEPLPIVITGTSTDEINGSDGSIDITVSGGTPPYGFNWNMGAGSSEDPSGLVAGSYTVTVTDQNFCTDTFTIVVNSQLGMEDLDFTYNLFPNPTNGMITIQLKHTDQQIDLSIEDISGRTVLRRTIADQNSFELDLTSLAEGKYFISISDGEKMVTQPIVIQH